MRVEQHELTRIVVAIDPAVTSGEDADDTGIVVVARGPHQEDSCRIDHCPGHGYVLQDATCHVSPVEWAREAIRVFDRWMADRIVAEVNNGGDMVGTTIHAVRAGVPYSKVTASRGKRVRAEPVSALYEQGRVHHVGVFEELEDELLTWTPEAKWSPNRLDALVWGLTFLGLVGGQGDAFMRVWQDELATPGVAPPVGVKGTPRFVEDDTPTLRQGCVHRFFTGRCVYCGGTPPTQP
jgi:phage terminase large subunit-like protein